MARQYKTEARVQVRDGFAFVNIRLEVARALRAKGEIQVRAVINEIPFHAVIRPEHDSERLWPFMEPEVVGYSLYLYNDMRAAIPMRIGTKLSITFTQEDHPRSRRGRRIRAASYPIRPVARSRPRGKRK